MLRSIKSKQRKVRELNLKTKAGTIALSIDDSGVTNADNEFASTAHGLITGDMILVTQDNTLPTGLTTATNYWVIKVDADTFKLASSYANAIAGTAVAISDDGTGANSYDLVSEIDGLDKHQVTMTTTAVGTYSIALDEAFASADSVSVVGNVLEADKVVTIHSISASTIVIKVNDIDETAALSNGLFCLRIIGSDVTSKY